LQAPLSPHETVHVELPWQVALQPLGQLISQCVLPVQLAVEPAPTVTLASAPPLIVIVLSGPASTMQSVVPAHDELQSAAQLSTHVDPPAQCSVHPVPHVVLHVFLLVQSYVTLFVGPPSPASPPPRSHTAPGAQLHTLPSHWHPPSSGDVQFATPASVPASAGGGGGGGIGFGGGGGGGGVGDASGPESPVSATVVSSLPHPTATATATRLPDPIKNARRSFVMRSIFPP
jgi:hypothetical protein